MKKILTTLVSIFFGCIISNAVLADDPSEVLADETPMVSMSKADPSSKEMPCRKIAEACRAAKKGANRREIWKNCMDPIVHGQTVAGVNVNPADVNACHEKMTHHPCYKLLEACKSAGKGANGREAWRNCAEPIVHGQKVEGVNVAPREVKACRERMAHRPCFKIAEACANAGKGTNLRDTWKTCVKPIANGEKIEGVNVEPAEVKACHERMKHRS